jgi:L-asparaginase
MKRIPIAALVLTMLFPGLVAGQDLLPRVTVIGTGGTIAGQSDTRTSFQDYRAGQLLIADMVNELRPQIDEVAEVTTVQFGNKGSGGYTIPEYYDLSLAIDEALETADAVVVTTGTGTQDEFVYWSELTVQSQKPVVFTGAMRPWTVIGTDAHANLFNAIVLAVSQETRCYGTVNILNDEFHAAKEVWKSDGSRMDTFIDRKVGILGYVDGLDVRTFRAPPRVQFCNDPVRWRTPFDVSRISRDDLPRVEMLMGYQDAGLDEAVMAWAEAGVDGIVLSGGRPSSEAREAAEAKGVVFTRTQRFRSGGDNLMPQKARLLLLLSLAFTDDPEQVAAWIDEIGGLEFQVGGSTTQATSGG